MQVILVPNRTNRRIGEVVDICTGRLASPRVEAASHIDLFWDCGDRGLYRRLKSGETVVVELEVEPSGSIILIPNRNHGTRGEMVDICTGDISSPCVWTTVHCDMFWEADKAIYWQLERGEPVVVGIREINDGEDL